MAKDEFVAVFSSENRANIPVYPLGAIEAVLGIEN
jgi:hypothetical protein